LFSKKYKFIHFFKTHRVTHCADLIATRIENTEKYFIHKNIFNGNTTGCLISELEFKKYLALAERPIILSDSYIELD
jgi:hypothetical protein